MARVKQQLIYEQNQLEATEERCMPAEYSLLHTLKRFSCLCSHQDYSLDFSISRPQLVAAGTKA